MADKLTPQQHRAVYDRGGNLLISAAAGSGKTKVLVDRLLSYLLDPTDPADLDDFLIITYTKAAASELRGKIAKKLSEKISEDPENRHLQKQMQRLFLTKISTVHGFCADVLREYAYRLDIAPDFRVADENECIEIRTGIMTELLDNAYLHSSEDPDFRAFVDTQGLGRTDSLVPEIVERVYDSAQCHMDPQGWLQGCLDAVDLDDVQDVSQTVWGKYLMDDLFAYLDDQIRVLERCCADAVECPGFEKPMAVLSDTIYQIRKLREAENWDELVHNSGIDYGRLTFPRKNPDPELSERIKAARSACKKGLEKKLKSFTDSSDQVLADLMQSAAGTRGLIKLVNDFAENYRQVKRSRRVLDFADLEHRTLDLLLGKKRNAPTAAAAEIGNRFREIMVDEYQDSNGVQDAIFRALTQKQNNCFMVGDVKQSIYQFRLADPGIFLEKYHAYVPAEDAIPGQGRKVHLSHNFRSGAEIIEGANDVFEACMRPELGGLYYGKDEKLYEGIPHEILPDPAVELYALQTQEDSYKEEAAFVAEKIRSMLQSGALVRQGESFRPVKPEDIVILLRSPGSIGKYYQNALERKGIRCTSGGGKDLLQTEEIGTLRSFLQIIVNPRQDIPLISALASPVFGFTADDLARIRGRNKQISMYESLTGSDHPKAKRFLSVLSELRLEARTGTLTQLLEKCYLLTHLDSIYGAMAGGEAKRANLQTFYRIAAEFESGSLRDLVQFLEHLDALEGRGLPGSDAGSGDCVTIMSIHKSKGLEFPVVFLAGLSRGFNGEGLRAQILCDKALGLGMSIADPSVRIRYPSVAKRAIMIKMASESLSEEMRILYVAMTRARDRLIMTYASKSLQGELEDIAMRMDFDGGKLVCTDTNNPGKWILFTALGKTEAGALHAIGGRPRATRSGTYPWKICVVEESDQQTQTQAIPMDIQTVPDPSLEMMRRTLQYVYPHLSATRTPSKRTATDKKGRAKDEEAAQDAQLPRTFEHNWRSPSFVTAQKQGKQYGNAMHAALQYIRYACCTDEASISDEVQRLVRENILKPDQAALVNCKKLLGFFSGELGQKLVKGAEHLREFKFSVLEDAVCYGEELAGESVLLQGVVDCALMESDGITIVDFKTDYATEETLSRVVERYCGQINTYAYALSRIYELPVKKRYLYLFSLDKLVEI